MSYAETIRGHSTRAIARVVKGSRGDAVAIGGGSLLVSTTALVLWLMSGVHLGEIARFVPYELGFVFLPGWVAYRALMESPGGRLRQIVLGWSLGYLLEILAFVATAEIGLRDLFFVYPVLIGLPGALLARRRRASSRTHEAARTARRENSIGSIWLGALLCALALVYAGAVGFRGTPLPRDASVVTYQEDTVFTISVAAEALHHWPMTVPMIAGAPLHYHLFAYFHMAAIAQVTGIDLSVVVMRLYAIPLLVLFALQLILAGRRFGRGLSVGLLGAFVVLFLGEFDASRHAQFLFDDFFFYWLLKSHTFLLGLTFFMPAIMLLGDLIGSKPDARRTRTGPWILVAAFLVGCIGAKSYALLDIAGGLLVLILWQLWQHRALNRAALFALGLSGALYVAANTLFLTWNSAGIKVSPFETVRRMGGVVELGAFVGRLWGSTHAPPVLDALYGTFGLVGVSIVGIVLLLRYGKLPLSTSEVWFLSIFAAGFPSLFLLRQPGFGQLFVVFFGVVPGAILAASGLRLFWIHNARRSLRVAAIACLAGAVLVVATAQVLGTSWQVQLQLTLLLLLLLSGLAVATPARVRCLARPVTVGIAFVGLVVTNTPLIRLLRLAGNAPFSISAAIALTGLTIVVFALVAVFVARPSVAHGLSTAAVGSCLALSLLNTPLDSFPTLAGRPHDVQSFEGLTGLTAGLYRGLLWVRDNTSPNAVLVVNNHSLYADKRDSKYFYYSAFAERRVVVESWDYTAQAAATGLFSLDTAHTPFFRRLALSDAVFNAGDENAIRLLARDYGASYIIVDKVHGGASPLLAREVQRVFSNGDVDVYAIAKLGAPRPPGPITPTAPSTTACASEQGAGIAAVFGHRRTLEAAFVLRATAAQSGFEGLTIQRRGCRDYAVVLTGLQDLRQAKDVQREAATVDLHVKAECRTYAPQGGLNAVFGHRRTTREAERLAARAKAAGFAGLDVQQDSCGDWEVDLRGLRTAGQRREFRREAGSVGFRITFEPG